MKRFFYFSLTLLALTTFSACSKDTEPSPAPYVAVDNTLTGSINGTALETFAYSYTIPSDPSEPGEMTLRFYVSADQSEYILVKVPTTIVPGTYDLTETGLESVYYNDANGDLYVSTSGTMQIERNDKTNHLIIGNFEASLIPDPSSTGTSTYDFTNMNFALNYAQ